MEKFTNCPTAPHFPSRRLEKPLYQDVTSAVIEGMQNKTAPFSTIPQIIGGRYGLASKEFTPSMIKAIFDEMTKDSPKNHFTVGIIDDVTNSNLEYDPNFSIEAEDTVRAVFWGLGADGTVGANKNSIKIISGDTDNFGQGYFVYDSKKSGGCTVSHLRFGPREIKSTYLVQQANFVAVHQFGFVDKYNVLDTAKEGATFLLNSPYGPEEVWDQIPQRVQKQILAKKLKFYVIDGYTVAKQTGMGGRINTVMQTCFFAISGVMSKEEAIEKIKQAIQKTYGRRGEAVVQKNFAAVDAALSHLHEVKVPDSATGSTETPLVVPPEAPEFVQTVLSKMIAGKGDELPVSLMPVDGTFPTATTQWEKRNIAQEVPVWEPDICIQCGKCVLVCPHAVIRPKVYDAKELEKAPSGFKSAEVTS